MSDQAGPGTAPDRAENASNAGPGFSALAVMYETSRKIWARSRPREPDCVGQAETGGPKQCGSPSSRYGIPQIRFSRPDGSTALGLKLGSAPRGFC